MKKKNLNTLYNKIMMKKASMIIYIRMRAYEYF